MARRAALAITLVLVVAGCSKLREPLPKAGLVASAPAATPSAHAAVAAGYGVSVGTLVILSWACFNAAPGATNSAQALLVLQILFLGLPTVLLILSAVALNKYPLGSARHAEVRAALAAREKAALDAAPRVAEEGA